MIKNILKNYKKLNGSIKFFLYILFLYFILIFVNYDVAEQTFFNFLELIKKIIPLLAFVFLTMVIVNLIFTKEKTIKYLGEKSGIKSWIYAIVGGILISGPPYVLYPMIGELKNKGMSKELIAVFLYNRNVKLAFLPALIHYFGITYTIILSFYIILFSILNGLLIKFFVKQKQ